MYRIVAPGGETSIAVNPPALPAQRVQLTAAEAAEVEREPLPPATWDLWRWLVLLAIVALWLEWWLYYAARERQRAAEVQEAPGDQPLCGIRSGTRRARRIRVPQSKFGWQVTE